jgi:ABC-2 type transport system ATP-binding protein
MFSGAAVETRALRRTFGTTGRSGRGGSEKVALDSLDLTIGPGEVHGLLGPNGAGKTTLCRILSTVLLPTSGRALVCGRDVVADRMAVRACLGVAFGGDRGLYGRLSARQNLEYWAAMYGVPRRAAHDRAARLLQRVGLEARAGDVVDTYSRGMKQRLHLARALVGDPRLVILDEPTMGMDPVAANDFRGLVAELRGEGRTILVTTHDLAEAEAICDRVSMIDGGRLLGTEDPRRIGSWLAAYERIDADGVPAGITERIAALPGVVSRGHIRPGVTRFEIHDRESFRAALRLLADAGVATISTGPPSLEEVYLHVIGKRGLSV